MITSELNVENGVVLHRCEGAITIFDIMRTAANTLSDQENIQFSSVWDLRNSEVSANQYQIFDNSAALLALDRRGLAGRKVAWLVNFDYQMQILEDIYRSREWVSVWRVFKSRSDAESWIRGESAAEKSEGER